MKKLAILLVLVFASGLILNSIACVSGDGKATFAPMAQPASTITSDPQVILEPVKITIGNLTDQTGVGSSAMSVIDQSLYDLVDYYNEHNLIPGIELQTKTYDTQYDPARAKTGYEYLRGKGVDVIWSPAPNAIPVVKPVADMEKFPVFVASAKQTALIPPGYVFSTGTMPQQDAYTLLKWIAENDWDYEKNGPAKIGGAAWSDGYSDIIFMGMKDYVDAHPEQYQWQGSYLTDFSFDWSSEVELLKNCDYIWPPTPMQVFVRDYTQSGYETTFIGSDGVAGFLGMIDAGNHWDEIDGMLFIRGSRWWTEDGPLINLTKEILQENHGNKAEEIKRAGVGYLASSCIYQLLEIIRNAAEEVGPENMDSQAIYDAAVTYTENIDGIDRYSFDETKRCSANYYVIYEADGEKEDLFRVDPDWIPVITKP